jgi:hypothetical protein
MATRAVVMAALLLQCGELVLTSGHAHDAQLRHVSSSSVVNAEGPMYVARTRSGSPSWSARLAIYVAGKREIRHRGRCRPHGAPVTVG